MVSRYILRYELKTLLRHITGEHNSRYHPENYTCKFSKLIEQWRSIWYTHTDSNTDPLFPFGFVQVKKLLVFILFCTIIPYLVGNKRTNRHFYWKISMDSLASNF